MDRPWNQLWVRLSLAFVGIIVVTVVLPPIIFSGRTNPVFEAFPELAERFYSGEFTELERQIERTIRRAFSMVVSIGGTIGVIVGILFSRTVTRPLDQLKDAAQAIQQKEFKTRVPEEGTQELVAVAQSFNSMAAQLEKAEELRRNLLSDVAHELRHPLHIINGNIEAMIDGVFPLDKEGLERIKNQAGLLTRLIDDLHELAQAEAQQIILDKRPIHVGQLVEQAAISFRPEAETKQIKLEVELLGKLPELNVDPERMKQVIFNLLSNAVRYTPENGKIKVSAEQLDDQVQIQIRDNGAGIDPADLPHVFDRFYRSDKARNREKSGTGLGLAIVKALIEAHDGTISVSSTGNGQGSLFTLYLPAR